MIFNDVLENGKVVNAGRGRKCSADYAVKISKGFYQVTHKCDAWYFYFTKGNHKQFDDQKIIPIIMEKTGRLYFAEQDKFNILGGVYKRGYKLNDHGGTKGGKKFIATNGNFDAFLGEYDMLHYDNECNMWYIEKSEKICGEGI